VPDDQLRKMLGIANVTYAIIDSPLQT